MKRLLTKALMVFAASLTAVLPATAGVNEGLTFLLSKQDSSGRVTQGYSNPSQWAAIAFVAHNVDIEQVASQGVSLKDFLLTDHPANGSAATEWQARILAITAIGEDPTNFGGVNYMGNLEAYYNNQQLGETYLLNDDLFGLLALIAGGNDASTTIKQDVLDFILTHQAPNGGFSWSPDVTCAFCEESADMTAAGLQALLAAQASGLSHANLDSAIAAATNYLLTSQHPDGGFGYSGSSDADSTAWAVMALNLAGQSSPAAAGEAWLTANQQPDGGFPSWSGSDSTTTAHSLIALSGQGWLVKSQATQPPPAPANDLTSASNPAPPVVTLADPTPDSTPPAVAAAEQPPPAIEEAIGQLPPGSGQVLSTQETTQPENFSKWRWLLMAVSLSSFAGAGYYGLRYNKGHS